MKTRLILAKILKFISQLAKKVLFYFFRIIAYIRVGTKNQERLAIIFNIYPHENRPDYKDWFKNGKEIYKLSKNTKFLSKRFFRKFLLNITIL